MSVRSLYESADVWSWFSAQSALYNAGTGVFTDRSARGNHWVQSNGGNLPSLTTNWRGTGLDARQFDGTDDYISPAGAHLAPLGGFSAVALCDLDASFPSGDNVARYWLANLNGTGTSQQFGFLLVNRRARVDSQGTSTAQTGLIALSTPTVVTYSVCPLNRVLAVRINGGAWTTVAMPVGAIPYRKAYQIGARAGDGATRAGFARSALAELVITSCPLYDTTHATLLADIEGTLAEMAGVTLA
jgi:hypothetical protein